MHHLPAEISLSPNLGLRFRGRGDPKHAVPPGMELRTRGDGNMQEYELSLVSVG